MHDETTERTTHITVTHEQQTHGDDPPPTIRDAPSTRRLAAAMMLIQDAEWRQPK
jgi:hypothetical protein